MDFLKRIFIVMVVILMVLVGAGVYFATTMKHGNMENVPLPSQLKTEQPRETAPQAEKRQNVNIILQPDLRNYIDEINKGISLTNEANGLITSDPFFADPPKVPKGKLDKTPFDKLIPQDRGRSILVLPDGTYQIIDNSGLNMRDMHRGIYKLGQGMTVLNNVLDKINEDVKKNNFPVGTGVINPYTNIQNITGIAHGTAAGTPSGGGIVSNFLNLMLIVFVLLAIISVIGFLLSLFRPKKEKPETNCFKCGSSVDSKWDFCPDCGLQLTKEPIDNK